jgi:hypothetical protein
MINLCGFKPSKCLLSVTAAAGSYRHPRVASHQCQGPWELCIHPLSPGLAAKDFKVHVCGPLGQANKVPHPHRHSVHISEHLHHCLL